MTRNIRELMFQATNYNAIGLTNANYDIPAGSGCIQSSSELR